jgi:hypothetical protein
MSTAGAPTELEAELTTLEHEIESMKGKIAGRKEPVAHALRQENKALKSQLVLFTEIAHSLDIDALHPPDEGSARIQLERLKAAVVVYCTKSKIEPGLWKKLAS